MDIKQNKGSYSLAGRHVFIALPAYDFKVSLKLAVALAGFTQLAPQHGIEVSIGSICGCSVVSRARNLLVRDFLDSNATDLMFIDSDMTFHPDDILRLMAWASRPEKSVVAGVGRTRDSNRVYFTTLDQDDDNMLTMDGMGLVRVKHVGTGFMLIRREVLETLVDEHPEWEYLDVKLNKKLSAVFDFKLENGSYMGEDYLFCNRARKRGFEVWVDPTIKLGHMGVQEYEGNFGHDVLYPMLVSSSDAA